MQICVAGAKRLLTSAHVHARQLFFNSRDKVFSWLDWIEHVMDGGSLPASASLSCSFSSATVRIRI